MNNSNLFLFRIWLVIGSVIFLFNLTCCQPEKENLHAVEKQKIKNSELSKYLCEKYNSDFLADSSKFFTSNYQKEILTKTVLLDSIVYSIEHVNNDFFINAEVKSDATIRIFARLKCSEDVFNSYSIIDSPNVILAVNIKSIKKESSLLEGISIFEGTTINTNIDDILIEGDCLEIVHCETLLANDSLG